MRRIWILSAWLMVWAPVARAADVIVIFGIPDRVTAGQVVLISWSDFPAQAEEGELEVSIDGRRWVRISPHLEVHERSFAWRVPDLVTRRAHIRLRAGGGEHEESVVAVSRAFRIVSETAPLRDHDPGWWRRLVPAEPHSGSLSVNFPGLSDPHSRYPATSRSDDWLQAPAATARLAQPARRSAAATSGGANLPSRPVFVPLRN